jgi:hypothetical protein
VGARGELWGLSLSDSAEPGWEFEPLMAVAGGPWAVTLCSLRSEVGSVVLLAPPPERPSQHPAAPHAPPPAAGAEVDEGMDEKDGAEAAAAARALDAEGDEWWQRAERRGAGGAAREAGGRAGGAEATFEQCSIGGHSHKVSRPCPLPAPPARRPRGRGRGRGVTRAGAQAGARCADGVRAEGEARVVLRGCVLSDCGHAGGCGLSLAGPAHARVSGTLLHRNMVAVALDGRPTARPRAEAGPPASPRGGRAADAASVLLSDCHFHANRKCLLAAPGAGRAALWLAGNRFTSGLNESVWVDEAPPARHPSQRARRQPAHAPAAPRAPGAPRASGGAGLGARRLVGANGPSDQLPRRPPIHSLSARHRRRPRSHGERRRRVRRVVRRVARRPARRRRAARLARPQGRSPRGVRPAPRALSPPARRAPAPPAPALSAALRRQLAPWLHIVNPDGAATLRRGRRGRRAAEEAHAPPHPHGSGDASPDPTPFGRRCRCCRCRHAIAPRS